MKGEWGKVGEESTHDFLAINPTFGVSNQFILSLLLLFIFLNGAFELPTQGLGDHDLSLIDNAVAAPTGLAAFHGAAAVSTSAVAGRVLRNWGRRHNFPV